MAWEEEEGEGWCGQHSFVGAGAMLQLVGLMACSYDSCLFGGIFNIRRLHNYMIGQDLSE